MVWQAGHVPVDDLESDKLIVLLPNSGDEEQRGVSPVDQLRVCDHQPTRSASPRKPSDSPPMDLPLYSKKLHILVLLASTSWVTSFTILPAKRPGVVAERVSC